MLLLVLASGLLALNGGLTWNALTEGSPGRHLESLAVANFAGLSDPDPALECFAETYTVDVAWTNRSGRIIAGNLKDIPPSLRETGPIK
ncbi:MAG: hypothetical protein WC205_15555 [Opitutaceae bacterium]|jgi:hypothetical protein